MVENSILVVTGILDWAKEVVEYYSDGAKVAMRNMKSNIRYLGNSSILVDITF